LLDPFTLSTLDDCKLSVYNVCVYNLNKAANQNISVMKNNGVWRDAGFVTGIGPEFPLQLNTP